MMNELNKIVSEIDEKAKRLARLTDADELDPNAPFGEPSEPKRFKWTVEFEVDERWVTDGFSLTPERAQAMIEGALPLAFSSEVKATVIKAPTSAALKVAQSGIKLYDVGG